MPAMRSQVSSLLQNGLKFGIENRRGNWNSLIRGCRGLVISPLVLLCLRKWPTACPCPRLVKNLPHLIGARAIAPEPVVFESDARQRGGSGSRFRVFTAASCCQSALMSPKSTRRDARSQASTLPGTCDGSTKCVTGGRRERPRSHCPRSFFARLHTADYRQFRPPKDQC